MVFDLDKRRNLKANGIKIGRVHKRLNHFQQPKFKKENLLVSWCHFAIPHGELFCCTSSSNLTVRDSSCAKFYHTTKTIFGKDQRMPVKGYHPASWRAQGQIWNVSSYLMWIHLYPHAFPPHSHPRVFSVQQRHVWMCYFWLFLCLLATYFVGSNHLILQFKSS